MKIEVFAFLQGLGPVAPTSVIQGLLTSFVGVFTSCYSVYWQSKMAAKLTFCGFGFDRIRRIVWHLAPVLFQSVCCGFFRAVWQWNPSHLALGGENHIATLPVLCSLWNIRHVRRWTRRGWVPWWVSYFSTPAVAGWMQSTAMSVSEYLSVCPLANLNKNSAIAEMGDRKLGAAVSHCWGKGELGPHLTQCGWAEAYLHTKWHLDASSRLAKIEMGRKLGALPLLGRGAGSPSRKMWPEPRPTSMLSAILIHPAIWPE